MFPVLNFEADLANLSAFTSLVMVEVSRLDAITSNKMKSDFISSISRKSIPTCSVCNTEFSIDEMRSPLHGILACADSLRGSNSLDETQLDLVSDVQNCGATLLVWFPGILAEAGLQLLQDTIEHVLDYSKINSFEKAGNQGEIKAQYIHNSMADHDL